MNQASSKRNKTRKTLIVRWVQEGRKGGNQTCECAVTVERERILGQKNCCCPSALCDIENNRLHNLVLGKATVGIGVHAVFTTTWMKVSDIAQAQRSATVLISLELRNGGFRGFSRIEADDTRAARTAAWLILDLGLLHLSDSGEQIDEVLITCGPRELLLHEYQITKMRVVEGWGGGC